MRKLVTVRTIKELNPIDGADAIEVATVDGWKVVVKKGEYGVGDRVVYCEIDCWIPTEIAPFLSKGKEPRVYEGIAGEKLRTIKLRGQISQGLLLPLQVAIDKYVGSKFDDGAELSEVFYVGADITDILGIKKWEPTIPANMAGQVAGLFPSFIRKTDQERCQNMISDIFGYVDTCEDIDVSAIPQDAIEKLIEKGDLISENGVFKKVLKAKADPNWQYEVTLKCDGSSVTFYKMDAAQGVCSRNLELKINEENKDNSLVRMFIDSGMKHVMDAIGENIAIQGELMGPGIQGNREGFKENKFFIFEVQDLENGVNYTPEMRAALLDDLYGYGVNQEMVKHAPIIEKSVRLSDLGLNSVGDLLAYAERKSINHPVAEGVVFKRIDGKFSFKAISNKFLEKEKD